MHKVDQIMMTERMKFGENNDCAVRALASATSKPYSEAHRALALEGRKNGQGVEWDKILPAARALGFNVDQCHLKAKTVATAPRKYPQGRYILILKRHGVAMVNGVVLDETRARKFKVKHVIKLERRTNAD